MNFKFLILGALSSIAFSKKCLPPTDSCGPVNSDSFKGKMTATLYSEPNFKGSYKIIKVNGAYGCSNDVPDYQIRSYLSSASTQVTFHYGKDCVGHVIEQKQGGNINTDTKKACPGSVFIKLNRYGSC